MRNVGESARAGSGGTTYDSIDLATAGRGSTIGGLALEEPLFLDEPADYARPAATPAGPSPHDLFASEDGPPLWATFPELGPSAPPHQPGSPAGSASPDSPRWRSTVSKWVLAVALLALAGIGAYQVFGLTPLEMWHLTASGS